MTAKTALFVLGVCVGAAAPVIVRLLRPLSPSVFARGFLAYEAACDTVERWIDHYTASSAKE
jgi:hypothetical protein